VESDTAIERRFAEADKLLAEGRTEPAMAIAEELVKTFAAGDPRLERANSLVRRINDRILEGNRRGAVTRA
jgi:hypothetical protein